MPLIELPDGTNLFVKSNDPKDIEQAKIDFTKKRNTGSSGSLAGDIGRGIAAGVVSIPQGLVPYRQLVLIFYLIQK